MKTEITRFQLTENNIPIKADLIGYEDKSFGFVLMDNKTAKTAFFDIGYLRNPKQLGIANASLIEVLTATNEFLISDKNESLTQEKLAHKFTTLHNVLLNQLVNISKYFTINKEQTKQVITAIVNFVIDNVDFNFEIRIGKVKIPAFITKTVARKIIIAALMTIINILCNVVDIKAKAREQYV
jgi:hypothetical protein